MPTIFLDLDGTLTDPKPGITRSIIHALENLGRPAPSEDALGWAIGPPLRESLASLVGEADADRALALYRERFAETGLFENRVYDGVPEMLEALRSAGWRLFLATSKPWIYAERIIDHFGLSPMLDGGFGSELDGTRADKSALLAHALAETGARARGSVMLGDRRHDVQGAAANGLPAIGALWGYGGRDELAKAGADCLAEGPSQVTGLADRLAASAPSD